jgi:hypothetical protein
MANHICKRRAMLAFMQKRVKKQRKALSDEVCGDSVARENRPLRQNAAIT